MAITESLCERTIRAVDGKVRVLFHIWRFTLVVSFEKTFIWNGVIEGIKNCIFILI